MTGSTQPLLEMVGISKSFGGVQALRDVDFSLEQGEIHGLVGENGAGKSTMMKIIAGVHSGYSGTMRLGGQTVHFRNARDALDAGIGMVHQELSIAPDLSVAENVYLGKQPLTRFGSIDWRGMVRGAREQLANLGIDVDPRMPIGELSIGLQQLIELARVLFSGARIVILDEPTSALSPPEVETLFKVLRRLKESGRSMVFISHFLDDILKVSDQITIFRNGQKIVTHSTEGHRQGLGDRAHDRRRSFRARGELYARDDARTRGPTRRSSLRPMAGPAAAPSATSPSACAPARSSASMASWVAASSNWPAPCSAASGRTAAPCRSAARQCG